MFYPIPLRRNNHNYLTNSIPEKPVIPEARIDSLGLNSSYKHLQ
uniref:Alternative protein PKHD1 n=1 Tax=Homo sapiens TaxID=9606 RepID=L0R5C3_HUMAN|nr:alternative protein PKHD1 [Homo sapiens]